MEVENILSDLIKIQSVNPPGGEMEVANYLKRLFDEYHIPNEIIADSSGRGNFIASIGEGKKSMLFLSHVDVVPVSAGWDFAPFAGEIKGGFIYGRGALDCKGLTAAEAGAAIRLALSGKLKGRLIFAATADEEAGGVHGVEYIVNNLKGKLMADFCVNEGGAAPLRVGNKVCHFIQTGEKGIAWWHMKTKGTSAHGSLPWLGDNAVVKMSRIITGLTDYKPEVILIPEVKQLIQQVAELKGIDLPVTKANLPEIIPQLGDRIFSVYLTACTRMSVSPNTVHGGLKTNIVPDACEADLDTRLLPGQDKEYVLKEFSKIFGETGVECTQYFRPTFSTSDRPYYRLMADTLKEFIGDSPVLPSISTGASDSRFLREAGMPCYGINMMTLNIDPAMNESVHGKNERLDIASLKLKTDFLVKLAEKYLA